MTTAERPTNNGNNGKTHFNPAVVEWAIPEEGMSLRLHLENPGMEALSPNEREKLALLLGRLALLCDYVVSHQGNLGDGGLEPEIAFGVTAEYLKDLMSLFQAMREPRETEPMMEEGFPF